MNSVLNDRTVTNDMIGSHLGCINKAAVSLGNSIHYVLAKSLHRFYVTRIGGVRVIGFQEQVGSHSVQLAACTLWFIRKPFGIIQAFLKYFEVGRLGEWFVS
jgi:hypothetical protein